MTKAITVCPPVSLQRTDTAFEPWPSITALESETIQVYASDTVTSATWAEKELKAYTQVTLAPGEERVVDVELPVTDCTLVNAAGDRVVEPGAFELLVGPSSRDEDLLRARFTVGA